MASDSDIKNLSHAQEETPEELERAKEWWAAHGNAVTAVLVVVLLAVLGTRWWKGRAEARENAAMTQLQEATTPDALERVVQDGGSRHAAALARLRLGAVQYGAGQYALAKSAYEDFLAAEPRHPLADVASYGVAQCEEALGNVEESVRLFREFGEKFAGSTLAPLATLGVARGLVLRGTDESRREGKAMLDLFLTEHAGEPWASAADELIRAHKRLSVPEKAEAASDIASFLAGGAPEPEEAPAAEEPAPAAEEPAPAVEEAPAAEESAPAAEEAAVQD